MGQTKKQPWFCDKLPFHLRHLRFNLIEQSERPFSWYLWTFNLFPSGRYHIIILQKGNPFSAVFEISVWQTSLPEGSLRSPYDARRISSAAEWLCGVIRYVPRSACIYRYPRPRVALWFQARSCLSAVKGRLCSPSGSGTGWCASSYCGKPGFRNAGYGQSASAAHASGTGGQTPPRKP